LREARAIEENFAHDLKTGVWQWEDFPSEIWARTSELSRRHAALGCRALDALHVASALTLAADDFYTFDHDQAKLAGAVGLRVLGS
jgi:predicted nucleic acid-binding protein